MVIVVGVDGPVKSGGDLRVPRAIRVDVHLSHEPLELGLIDPLEAGERGGGGGGGGGGGHGCLVCDEDDSEGVKAHAGSKALRASWIWEMGSRLVGNHLRLASRGRRW